MTEQHRCVVGWDDGEELREGDDIPADATAWNHCPECGRHHGAADEAQAAARERALLALPPIAPCQKTWDIAMQYVWSAIGARQRGLLPRALMFEGYVRAIADRALSGYPPRK